MQSSQCVKIVAPRKSYTMKNGEEEGRDITACLQLWDEGVREPLCPLVLQMNGYTAKKALQFLVDPPLI
jgi:hypothetical protein